MEGKMGTPVLPDPPGPGEVTAPERLLLFLDGTLGPEDLTDDECLRGQIVGINGKFAGRPGKVPGKIVRMLQRELKNRMEQRFAEHLGEAVDTIVDVMRNGEGEQISQFERAGTKRLDAAKYVVERIMGPIPKEVHVNDDRTPWQEAVESGDLIIDVREPGVVVDVEVVDETRPPRRRSPRGRRPT